MDREIIHVIESIGIGGAQSMMYELYEAIRMYYPSVKQRVIVLNKKRTGEGNLPPYNIHYFQTLPSLFRKIVLEMEQPPLVLFHKLMNSTMEEIRKLIKKCPIVAINHTQNEPNRHDTILPVDHVVAVCSNMRKTLVRFCFKTPISVIYNGINGANYRSINPMKREEGNVFITGRTNVLNTIKYSNDWINWCARVKLPKKMIHEYIGGGSYYEKALSLVASKKSPTNEVRVLGPINDFQEKISRVKSWDIFLYEINRNEGLSISVLEALACGVPVICSNHHGNNEVIKNGINGYVFDNHEEAEMFLTELCLDDKMLSDLKESTLKYFDDNLDARFMAKHYIELFEKICSGEKFEVARPEKIEIVHPKPFVKAIKQKIKVKRKEIRIKQLCIRQNKIVKKTKVYIDKVKFDKSNVKLNEITDEVEIVEEVIPIVLEKSDLLPDQPELFSILTSSYNSAKYLDNWVDSIITQTYRPLEVILVDDCSNDSTKRRLPRIINRLISNSIQVKVIQHKESKYCGSSYAEALRNASGKFFGVLDSDDMIKGFAVEYIINLYHKYPQVSWIYTQFNVYDEVMQYIREGFSQAPSLGNSLLSLGPVHAFSHWRTFSDRLPDRFSIFQDGLRCAVDKYMGYRMEELGPGMFANRVCYKYRARSHHSISTTMDTRSIWKKIRIEARKRRQDLNIKPHQISILKNVKEQPCLLNQTISSS